MFRQTEKIVKKALIAAVLLWGIAGSALAVGNIVDVSVYDRAENRTLPVYYHEGRYYVVGRPGNEYQVNVRNNQSGEILGVVSVDGINAVSGETATWGQTGYVLGAHMSYGVKGWRKNLQRVAAFYFTEIENSYAARTGRPDNVGVIGVAVFRKKAEPPIGISRDFDRRREAPSTGAPAGEVQNSATESVTRGAHGDSIERLPSTVTPQPAQKSLGTGHGQSETSVVKYANFERASSAPEEVITIYYDSYRNLVAQGVIGDGPRIARPQPFPQHFVPDPR
jgi:hypothetical protein